MWWLEWGVVWGRGEAGGGGLLGRRVMVCVVGQRGWLVLLALGK